ncbi:MAG: cellulase family glycosylhydrolase [Clostridia bacterium]|nr:cellulase family glycosylhydrolase [Clostridia bacterium]
MKKIDRFSRGMGIGGWLTNYKRFHVLPPEKRLTVTVGDMEHFEHYITEEDVKYIASLGMDHIRLGFDQIVVEESPYVYRKEILAILHSFVNWCKGSGLRPVLNMHKALGNYCDILEEKGLMQDEELQNRFIALWTKLEDEFSEDGEVFFELLNEVVNASTEEWNALAEKTVQAIRAKNPRRVIILGGNYYNSPEALPGLKVFDDENIIYTFHVYQPQEFTHQRGVLNETNLYYNREMPYPCDDVERYREYRRINGLYDPYKGVERIDVDYMRKYLTPAADFVKTHPDKILWCGEFGTIRHAKIEWRENWMRDVIAILMENDIPYSVWNYLSTPNDGNRFSLVDDDNRKILSERMAEIIRGEL